MKIISNATLVDIDHYALSDRWDIVINDDTIIDLYIHSGSTPEGVEVIDATDFLIHPGFINCHTHSHGNLAKGMGDRWTLELLLTAGPWISGNRNTEDKELTTTIGACEMLLKGCTACYDLTYEFPVPSVEGIDACRKSYENVGLRALVAPMVADLSLFNAIPGLMDALPTALSHDVDRMKLAPTSETLAALAAIYQHATSIRGEGLVDFAIAPTIPLHCTEEFLQGCRHLSDEWGLRVHSHLSESKIQAISSIKRYGKTLTQFFNDMGIISERFTAAHGVWLTSGDLHILGDHGSSVAHNPGSNMRLGSGIANMRAMLEHHVNVGIGTDGSSSSDNQNMYEAMRFASFASKVRQPDPGEWMTTREVFSAATVGGAKLIGMDGHLGMDFTRLQSRPCFP